jgi:hypothetical protein
VAATVRLQDLVDALEMQFDEYPSYLDLDTGRVATIARDLLRAAEESDEEVEDHADPSGEDDDEWEIAKRIVFTNRFRKLPSKYDVHEWAIMEKFSYEQTSETVRQDLLNAVHGAGAFRYFKDRIRLHGIEQNWHSFRTEALKQIAIDWCEKNEIAWR